MAISKSFWLRTALAASGCLAGLSAAHAQQSANTAQVGGSSELEEITVTARKRTESILNVPVDVQALPASQLQTFQVTQLTDLPSLVPGLNFGTSLLSIGTLVSIRGIGTASQDPGVDQSVALNIDGLALGNGLAFSSGMFDIGSVEVLKGPQTLFFGKESPGGVVSLNTADPTDQFEMSGTAAYEFESVQPRAEFIVSGPVTDTLKLRLATMYDQQEGYFYNDAMAEPGTGAAPPGYTRAPWGKESITRITALWDPTAEFSVKLKINEAYERYSFDDLLQFNSCPGGTAPQSIIPGVLSYPDFIGGGENCLLDRTMREVNLSPTAFPGILNGGTPFLMADQRYGTLTLHYRPTGDQDFSSTTGYYHVTSSSMVNPSDATYAGPFIGVNNRYYRHDFTEEVRDTSDYKGPLNYTLGALLENGYFSDQVEVLGNTGAAPPFTLPPNLVDGITPVAIKTRSVFGQIRWDIIDRLEFAPGVRWTDEDRTEDPYNVLLHAPTVTPQPSLHYNNTSPEVTLTYRPTDEMTFYGAYKQGFKSGSFSTATPPTAGENNSFGEEKVRGGELGMKSLMLDRQLSVNVVPYFYRYEGLQVGVISPPQAGVPIIQTLNAATAHIYGVDLDGAFRPAALSQLQINGNAEFNHGRYLDFTNAPCWGGQSISQGCNQSYNPTTKAYTAQDLTGTPLIRAPNLTVNVGFTYTMPVMNDYKLEFSNNNSYTTRYVTDLAIDRPGNDNYQGSYAKIDAGLKLHDPTNFWEVALIANNINNKVTSGNCASSAYKTGVIIPNPSGGATPGPPDAMTCFADPGREIWLRVTVRPFGHGS
jgi:iron complex outermembrane receptor protein